MKRKSTLILIAALVLAVTIPVFALAETSVAVQPLDGTGNMYGQSDRLVAGQGSRLMQQDCDEDCDCEEQGTGLGADGVALHQNARTVSGRRMFVRGGGSADCEICASEDQLAYGNRSVQTESSRGQRWSK